MGLTELLIQQALQPVQSGLEAVASNTGVSLAPADPLGSSAPSALPVDDRIAEMRIAITGQNSPPPATGWRMSNRRSAIRLDELEPRVASVETTQQQQQTQLDEVPSLISSAVDALVGGALPSTLDTLKELVAHIHADESGATALLAAQNADRTRFAALEAPIAALPDQLAAKANATTVQGLSQRVGTVEGVLTGKADVTSVTAAQNAANAAQSTATSASNAATAAQATATSAGSAAAVAQTTATNAGNTAAAAQTTANAAQAAANGAQATANAAQALAAAVQTALAAETAKRRTKRVATPAMLISSNPTVSVVWDTPFADNNYTLQATLESSNSALYGIVPTITAKSAAGATVTLKILLALGAGAGTVHFTASHD